MLKTKNVRPASSRSQTNSQVIKCNRTIIARLYHYDEQHIRTEICSPTNSSSDTTLKSIESRTAPCLNLYSHSRQKRLLFRLTLRVSSEHCAGRNFPVERLALATPWTMRALLDSNSRNHIKNGSKKRHKCTPQ